MTVVELPPITLTELQELRFLFAGEHDGDGNVLSTPTHSARLATKICAVARPRSKSELVELIYGKQGLDKLPQSALIALGNGFDTWAGRARGSRGL